MRYANKPFQHIYLVNDKLELHSSEELTQLEEAFGVTFPKSHKDLLQIVGSGLYCDHIRIRSPQEIIDHNRTRSVNEDVRRENGSIALSPQQIRKSIIIADSIDGDQIVFVPDEPEKLYVLLRGYAYSKVCVVPRSFRDLMLWIDAEGRLESAAPFPYFASWKDRKEQWLHGTRKDIMLIEVIGCIEELAYIQIKAQVSQRYEEGTSTTCFIPAIRGSITFNEEAGNNTQEVESLINIEYDMDFKELAEEIILRIREVGFQ